MRKIVLIIIAILATLFLLVVFISVPVLKSLSNCLNIINAKQEPILKLIRNKELTKEEIGQSYSKYLGDIFNCRYKAAQDTKIPIWIVDIIYNKSDFRVKEFPLW